MSLSRAGCCLLGLVFAAALPALAALPSAAPAGVPHRLLIGVPEEDGSPAFAAVREALLAFHLASRRSPFERPVELEITRGNPYQLLAWLEDSRIDGAIVSPLIYQLIKEQVRTDNAPAEVVKVVGALTDQTGRGVIRSYSPWVQSRSCSRSGAMVPRDDPGKDLDAALRSALDAAAGLPTAAPPFRLVLPNHLSAAAFALVLSGTQQMLEEELAGTDLAARAALEGKSWEELFKLFSFSLGEPASCRSEVAPADAWIEVEFAADGSGMQAGWTELPVREFDGPIPIVDLLVVHSEAAERVLPPEIWTANNTVTAESLFDKLFWNASLRPVLEGWLGRADYYDGRAFAFSLPETMALLRAERRQRDQADLALVLPGGGVKAAYQSVMIDYLYGQGLLRNDRAAAAQPDERAIPVKAVVGNSGGALLGFFVARLKAGDNRKLGELLWRPGGVELESGDIFGAFDLMRWATILTVFTTFCGALFVIPIFFRSLPFKRLREDEDAGSRLTLSLSMCLLLGATPLLVKYVEGDTAREHVPAIEGLFYFVFLCLALLADNCLVRCQEPARVRLRESWGALALIGAGTVLVLVPTLWRWRHPAEASWLERKFQFAQWWMGFAASLFAIVLWGVIEALLVRAWRLDRREIWRRGRRLLWGASAVCALLIALVIFSRIDSEVGTGGLVLCLGMFGVFFGFALLRRRRQHRYSFRNLSGYVWGLAIPILVVVLTYLGIVGMAAIGRASTLELTGLIWWYLVGFSLLFLILLLGLALASGAQGRLGGLYRGFSYLYSRHPAGAVGMVRYSRLFLFFTVGFLWWNLALAPALYGNGRAKGYLEGALTRFQSDTTAPAAAGMDVGAQAPMLQTLFAVPANTLAKSEERYFLFTPEANDEIPAAIRRDQRWRVFQAPATCDLVKRFVFASGSPFPIFPPHKVAYEGEEETVEWLIDGGYAHNIPIEAVGKLGMHQVLVLHSTNPLRSAKLGALPPGRAAPESDGGFRLAPDQILGPLALNLPRLVPFLFARSQVADALSRKDLFVVSIAPSASPVGWPLLHDFRPEIVREMHLAANDDQAYLRRVGRVESWSAPTRHFVVREGEWIGRERQ